MGKKILIGIMILVCVAMLFACKDKAEQELSAYKEAAKQQIENYAGDKGQNNYSAENWALISKAVEDGKRAAENAADTDGVNEAIRAAKETIDNVERQKAIMSIEYEKGYSRGKYLGQDDKKLIKEIIRSPEELSAFFDGNGIIPENDTPDWERYDNGFFDTKALIIYSTYTPSISIAYVLDDVQIIDGQLTLIIAAQTFGSFWLDQIGYASYIIEVDKDDIEGMTGFETDVEYVDILEIQKQAKKAYLDAYLKAEHPEAAAADVSLRPYLGVYGGSLVAVFYGGQYHGDFPDTEEREEVAELEFIYPSGYPILVYTTDGFCGLTEAYQSGLLKKADIKDIFNFYYDDELDKTL